MDTSHRAFSFGRFSAITTNTLTELTRLKVFYFLLIFALLLIGSSIFMARVTFQQEFQILKDVSLGAMSIFTSLLAIVATARLIPQDIDDRTIYTILAKPVPRFEYVIGKLAGVLLLLAISTLVMSSSMNHASADVPASFHRVCRTSYSGGLRANSLSSFGNSSGARARPPSCRVQAASEAIKSGSAAGLLSSTSRSKTRNSAFAVPTIFDPSKAVISMA